ncbi:PH domain [Carpediemonas membranifera]|uniref:PH domain n=1 Tax=Carpediemonas membranifera TaxID=201153 RepID=A0A8J6EA12_9EUKA|nr:PH domain [Carpediemonas membranifera]|eukprot:KAG9394090.1 PH domain [Carpediemonas membranifera]
MGKESKDSIHDRWTLNGSGKTILWEGWIIKQGGRIKNWKKRWMILVEGSIFYFANSSIADLKGYLPLCNSKVETDTEMPMKGYETFNSFFKVVTATRTMVMSVESADARAELLEHIGASIRVENYRADCSRLGVTALASVLDMLRVHTVTKDATDSRELVLDPSTTLAQLHLVARQIVQSSVVSDLILDDIELGTNHCKLLADVLCASDSIKKLSLIGCSLEDDGMEQLGCGVMCSLGLRKLFLDHNNLTNRAARVLGDVLQADPCLVTLSAAHNKIGHDGAHIVTALGQNSTLRVLDLSYNDIGDDGAIALADALSCNAKVTHVEVSYTGMTEAGLAYLAGTLPLSSTLKVIGLAGAAIDEDSARMLADSVHYTQSLERIDISKASGLENSAVMAGVGGCLVEGDITGLKLLKLRLRAEVRRRPARPLPGLPPTPR